MNKLIPIWMGLVMAQAVSAYDLPTSIEQDRLYYAAQDFVEAKKFKQAQVYLERLKKIGVSRYKDFNFYYGKVLIENRRTGDGIFALKKWLKNQTSQSKKKSEYRQALALLTRVDKPSGYQSITKSKTNVKLKKGNRSFRPSGEGINTRAWLEDLKLLYWTKGNRETLLTHINTMLNTYQPKSFGRSVRVSNHDLQGESRVRSKLAIDGRSITSLNQVEELYQGYVENVIRTPNHLVVNGVDPSLDYQCDIRYCFFVHPATGEPFMFFEENERAIRELSLSLSSLIIDIQRES